MADDIELNAADFITIGTIGPPGRRVFHLQASEDDTLLTLTLEKFQATAIAESIQRVLVEIQEQLDITTAEPDLDRIDLHLREPILPLFRVGQIGLGYDQEDDRLILVLNELLPDDDPTEPRTARVGASRDQMAALAAQALAVAAAGRPICPSCGKPIDADGHFCPKSNGHRSPVPWA